MVSALERAIRPVRRRVAGMIRRAVLASLTDEGAQKATVRSMGDTVDGADLIEPVGLTAKIRKGADVLLLHAGGNPDDPVALAWERRGRPTDLADGEVALWHGDGATVELRADGSIVITPSGAGTVKIGGDAAVNVLALHAEMVQLVTDIVAVTSALQAFWSALVVSTWAVDGVALKTLWGSTITPLLTTLATHLAAVTGSDKGRG